LGLFTLSRNDLPCQKYLLKVLHRVIGFDSVSRLILQEKEQEVELEDMPVEETKQEEIEGGPFGTFTDKPTG
jgi:hypothetical protein